MSKLFDLYNKLKSENPEKSYLFQSGIFYIALQDDAKKLSELFNFKITNLTPDIIKVGFPVSSLDKYLKLFRTCNINIELIDTKNMTLTTSNSYLQNANIALILNKIEQVDLNNLSVAETYEFIDELKKLVKNGDDCVGAKK